MNNILIHTLIWKVFGMAKDEEEDIPTRKDGMNKRKGGEEGRLRRPALLRAQGPKTEREGMQLEELNVADGMKVLKNRVFLFDLIVKRGQIRFP